MQSAVTHCRLAKLNGMPGFKRPTLQELHFKLFKKYFDKAHDALADTQACMKCFFELKRLGNYPNISELEGSDSFPRGEKIKSSSSINNSSSYINTSNNDAYINLKFSEKVNEIKSLKAYLESAQSIITAQEEEIEFYNSDEGLFTRASKSDDIEWLKALARHPRCPEKILIEICLNLAIDYDEELAICVIQNNSLPNDHIKFLIEEVDEELANYAAKNSSCDADLLAQIVWYDFKLLEAVKANRSYNHNALEALLQTYTGNANYKIRRSVAEFKECPQYLLKTLSYDKDIDVRAAVADNISCNSEILLRLAEDDNEHVRDSALENNNHPQKKAEIILEKISNEIDNAIAFRDVEKLKNLSLQNNLDICLKLANHNKCPRYILSILANHINQDVRLVVAEHHNCSFEVYELLSKDSIGNVRMAVAKNLKTPAKVLTELSKSNFYEYRIAVVLNPNTPETIIELLKQDKDIHVSQAIKKGQS